VTTTELTGAGGIRLAADEAGDPSWPPAILLHGGGQTRHAWGTTLETLADKGWHVYSVDLRGHGDSEWAPDGDYTLDAFAGDVRTIAREMPEPPVLVGASLGGISSLTAIAETPPPPLARALVLVDVVPRIEWEGVHRIGDFMTAHLDEGFGSLDEVADAIAAYNPHRPRPKDLSGLTKNLRKRPDGRWTWHWDPAFVSGRRGSPDETRASTLTNEERLRDDARAITVPVLLVRGRMSDIVSDEGARELLELVPQAREVDVAAAGHMVAGDRNDLFNDAVVDFLDSLRQP
jgi:pimeloyl-ACP methyl ester carboxylesterase